MVKIPKHILLAWLFINLLGCSEHTADSENHDKPITGVIFQIPGCEREGLQKIISDDGCFSYTFEQDLAIDFCVSANCCPDSNRFEVTYNVHQDSIIVAVADTAARLCRCFCDYVIHAEFYDLPGDRYVFYCFYLDSLIYSEEIRRDIPT
jgi:hypothetical protein